MPSYIPAHSSFVLATGILEMIFGLMLITQESQHIGAFGILVLLILFIPIHVHMLIHKEASLKLPRWILILRIPLQLLLIYWVYLYV